MWGRVNNLARILELNVAPGDRSAGSGSIDSHRKVWGSLEERAQYIGDTGARSESV